MLTQQPKDQLLSKHGQNKETENTCMHKTKYDGGHQLKKNIISINAVTPTIIFTLKNNILIIKEVPV
jgi:hypothetical protein